MKRRLLNMLAGSSLILCLAMVSLWMRSFGATDNIFLSRLAMSSSRGFLSIDVLDYHEPFQYVARTPSYLRDNFLEGAELGGHQWWLLAGFGLAEYSKPTLGDHAILILFPHWFPCLIFLLLPLGWMESYRRRSKRLRRLGRVICPNCGYDLRATPCRCPECGEASDKTK